MVGEGKGCQKSDSDEVHKGWGGQGRKEVSQLPSLSETSTILRPLYQRSLNTGSESMKVQGRRAMGTG